LTTSDKGPRGTESNFSAVKALVVIAIVGAAVFGLYLGYLAWSQDSFPTATKPFGNYAVVTSDTFNGTEFAFNLTWENASALPVKVQLTSQSTDAANTPVCEVGLTSVTKGQNIFMPFSITPGSTSLTSVSLNIDVQPTGGGGDFTITYNVASISASNTPITPSDITCQEPAGIE
jgi:hypothetical protein